MLLSVVVDTGKACVRAGRINWCAAICPGDRGTTSVRCAVGAKHVSHEISLDWRALSLGLVTVVVVHCHVISRLTVAHGVVICTEDTRGMAIRAGPLGHETVDGLNA